MLTHSPDVIVLYATFEHQFSNEKWFNLLSKIPIGLQNKVQEYAQWRDYQASLIGNLLLKKGMQLLDIPMQYLNSIQYTEKGKPYSNYPFFFNISHSGKYVVCAISKEINLGFDIEKHRNIDFTHFERYFSTREWTIINESSNPNAQFFEFWSIKESTIKADGRGTIVLKATETIEDGIIVCKGNTWFYTSLIFEEEYSASLTTQVADFQLKKIFIDLEKTNFD